MIGENGGITGVIGLPNRIRMKLALSVTGIWIAGILILIIIQSLGGPFGMSVQAMGEDRTWTNILSHRGNEIYHAFWAVDYRNPLSPWWYRGLLPLIVGFTDGLYVARKIMDPFLGIVTALFVNELARGRRPIFALACGMLVIVWNFSGYREQIMIPMLIALGFSILSLFFYAFYLNSRRSSGIHLAFSLVAFLVALATYSIQCGIPLSIAALGLAYGRSAVPEGKSDRGIAASLIEAGFFVIMFILYSMIWTTTTMMTMDNLAHVNVNEGSQLIHSLLFFAWHFDSTELVRSLVAHERISWSISAAIAMGLLAYWLMNRIEDKFGMGKDRAETSADTFWVSPMVLAVISSIGIIVPTIALETLSGMWVPGTRSRMVQQAFQPVVYLGIAFISVSFMGINCRKNAEIICATVLIFFGALLSFEYNAILVDRSAYEQEMVWGLRDEVPESDTPLHVFVRSEGQDTHAWQNPYINNLFVKQTLASQETTIDFIFRDRIDTTDGVILGPDDKGVYSPLSKRYFPYDHSVFYRFDGRRLTPIYHIDSSVFSGYSVKFSRTDPLDLSPGIRNGGSIPAFRFDFDTAPPGRGWSIPETSASGETFVWMAAKSATLSIDHLRPTPYHLSFRTLQPVAPELPDHLRLRIGRKTIPLSITDSDLEGRRTYSADIDSYLIDDGKIELTFIAENGILPLVGIRELALPFHWLKLYRNRRKGFDEQQMLNDIH